MKWRLMQRLMNIETGGEEITSGGEVDTVDAVESDPVETVAEDSGPKSMLEAIEQGMKREAPEGEAAEEAGQTRDAQGRFAKKDDAQSPQDKINQEPAAKPTDELAMPEGLTPKAQERFQTLVSRVKEREETLAAVTRDMEEFRSVITETGASPQDFSQALDYMRMVNHGDLQGALQLLDNQRRQIALALGQPLPGADPLSEFPDLRQRVDNYQMDEAAAIEIARSRMNQQRIGEQRQQHEQSVRAQEAAQAERSGALSQIDQMSAQWAKTDPDYAAKEGIILNQIKSIAEQFPPAMWPHQVRMLYETISAMPRAETRRASPAPLRSSGQAGGSRQPSSMLEAIQTGLNYANG